MTPRPPPSLLALTPGELVAADGARELERRVRLAFGAGLRGVVLREAGLPDRAFLALAHALRAILDPELGGWLALHDRPHLVRAAGADAVHLGGASLPIGEAKSWLDPRIAIGLSTHAEDDPASWLGADYIVHGPVRATTKLRAREPIGFDALGRAVERGHVPVWGLGGLEPEDADAVARSGASGMAVLSGLLARGEHEVEERARSYVERWRTAMGEVD